MRKILLISVIALFAFAIVGVVGAGTLTIVSDTNTLVYGPINYYAEISSTTDWGNSTSSVLTWVHYLWPTIDGASWISSAYYVEDPQNDSWRLFEREIELPVCVTILSGNVVSITSDNAEEVYLNGDLIGSDGEVQGAFHDDQEWNTIKSYPLTGLQAGTNKLQFIVRNYAMSGGSSTTNPTGLIYKAEITYDELPLVTCYLDSDGDGYGDPNNSKEFCGECGKGYVEDNTDCDDSDSAINPDAQEVCDTVDNNCDGDIDTHTCNWYCAETEKDLWQIDGSKIGTAGYLGVNRLMWTDDYDWDDHFTTLSSKTVKGKTNFFAAQSEFTLDDTNGCSCSQILEILHEYNPEVYGEMEGHWKFGCSKSVIEEFIRLAVEHPEVQIDTFTVPATTSTPTQSNVELEAGKTYKIVAEGTYYFRTYNHPQGYLADAEWALRNDSYGTGWVKGDGSPYSPPYNGLDLCYDTNVNTDWGPLDEINHRYSIIYTPSSDGKISFVIKDSAYGDNSGYLTVTIYRVY